MVDDKEVKIMVARLVPTASTGLKLKTWVKKGTMNTPPPTPTIEAIIPMKKATSGSKIMSVGVNRVSLQRIRFQLYVEERIIQ